MMLAVPVLRASMFLDLPEPTVRAALSELDSLEPPRRPPGAVLTGTATPTGALTLLVCTARWPSRGRVLDVLSGTVARRPMLRTLDAACRRVRQEGERLAALPAVSGTALIDGGRVLAAQRGHPPELAGRWELPGGRVEPGESEPDAAARECAEELGLRVRVGERVGPDVPIGEHLVLRVYAAAPADPEAVAVATEHRALRWLRAAELDTVDWLEPDLVLLPALRALLNDTGLR